MYHAIKAGLTLAVLIIVLKAFVPEIADGLIEAITKVLAIANDTLNYAGNGLSQSRY